MSAVNLKSLEKSEVENILGGFDTILSDCDGVLWSLDKAIEGVPEAVKKLKENGKRLFYVTNNPRKTRQGFAKKMQAIGYDVEPEEVVCVSYLVATYLKSINFNKKVYLLGDPGIAEELDAVGIRHIGFGPDILTPDLVTVVMSFVPDPEVGAVVIGVDEHISYPKLMKAATYLNDPNVLFLATSMDPMAPTPKGNIPGTGALVKCVESCSGRKAFVLGKPEPYMKQALIEKFNINMERTLLVGDSLHTDILLGKRSGVKTLLVLSGITTEGDVKSLKDSTAEETRELIPDFYTDSLADINSYL